MEIPGHFSNYRYYIVPIVTTSYLLLICFLYDMHAHVEYVLRDG